MAGPEYMNDLRKSSQLGFGVYSWLQLVDLVSRHMSEVYETYFLNNQDICWLLFYTLKMIFGMFN